MKTLILILLAVAHAVCFAVQKRHVEASMYICTMLLVVALAD